MQNINIINCQYKIYFWPIHLMTAHNLNILYHRPTDVTLTLKDPHYPDHYLGIILLSVILTPKEGEHRDVVSCPTAL